MSKANDPFNFDDLYKQAGVDNLFVKKSMAEQKAMAPRPGASTPTRPSAPNGIGSYGASTASQAGTPQTVHQGSPVKGFTSGSPALGSSNSLKGMDLDPFADLGGLGRPPPMSASKSSPPVPAAARPPTPPQSVLANSSSHPAAAAPARSASPAAAPAAAHTFDLEDMFGPQANSSPQQQQTPSSTAAAAPEAAGSNAGTSFDPFSAFGTVEGAAAAVPASAAAPSPAPPAAAAAVAQPAAEPRQPSRAATPVQQHQQPTGSNSRSATPTAPAAAKPSSAYFAELEQRQQQQQPQQQSQMDPDGRHTSSSSSRYSAYAENPSSFSSIGAAEHRLGQAAAGSYIDRYGSTNSSAYDIGQTSYQEQAGGSGKGWGGLLKSVTKTAAVIGKKGLKAAQAGLAQLESAIENLDKPTSSTGRPYSGSGVGADADLDMPAERVLSIAIHISELPSTRQEEALARLPRPVRQKVLALLREQAVIEGEEQLQQPAAAAGGADGVIHTREFDLSDAQEQAAAAAAAAARPERSSPPAGRRSPAASTAVQQQPPAAAASQPAAPPPVQVEEDDLLGMASPAATAAATPPAAAKVASVGDIDDFFSGGTPAAASANAAKPAQAAAAVPRPRSAGPVRTNGSSSLSRVSGSDGRLADLLGGASSSAAAGAGKGSSLIHLGGLEALDVDVGAHNALYDDGDGAADGTEPEIRRQLRAARAAEKHAKMKAALAEKQAKEAAEAERRQQQQAHKQAHKERIEAWKNKNKGNVRGLLGSLQTVLWEDSGWKTIGMGDLLEPAQVRKAWMKANLLVHPDKVRQRSGSDEQVAIADMIFDALKKAWGQFRV